MRVHCFVCLLDAGADSLTDWDAARNEARRLSAEVDAGTETLIVAYGLPTGHRVVDPADLDRLQRGPGRPTADDGLRALRSATAESRWETAEAVWVMRPSWSQWSPDVGLIRAALWPGRIALPVEPVDESGLLANATDRQTSAWIFAEAIGSPLQRALEALEVRVVSGEGDAGTNPDWIYAEEPTTGALDALLDRAAEGSSLVLSGRLSTDRAEIPWTFERETTSNASDPSGFVLPAHDAVVGSAVTRKSGAPRVGAHVIAVFEDATPAAAAHTIGRGCVVYVAAGIVDSMATRSPDYPVLLQALAEGCQSVDSDDGPLDRGALLSLERPDLPRLLDVASLGGTGYPLTGWLLLFALACLALEVGLTWKGSRRGPEVGRRGEEAAVRDEGLA